MQQYSLRIKSYRSWKINEREVSDIARERFKKLELFWRLKQEKCSESTTLIAVNCSRATIYRWQKSYNQHGMLGLNPQSKAPNTKRTPCWSRSLEQQVLHLRKKYPLWGKKTLTTILKRDLGVTVSESTVGRILKKLVNLGRVHPVCFYYGRIKNKKRRIFNRHAQRWQRGFKAIKPGQLLQIDHMTVSVGSNLKVKHFEATCPVTKITVARAYRNASSKTAAKFLKYVLHYLPFALESIQVDGGSEFMKDFEKACEDSSIKLYVIPPRTPELNGCVERCNRTLRYEFYRIYDGIMTLGHVQSALIGYINEYNSFRESVSNFV